MLEAPGKISMYGVLKNSEDFFEGKPRFSQHADLQLQEVHAHFGTSGPVIKSPSDGVYKKITASRFCVRASIRNAPKVFQKKLKKKQSFKIFGLGDNDSM